MPTQSNPSARTITLNKWRAIITGILRTAALLCVTGPLMQTFLNVIGFSKQEVLNHTTLYQAVNVLTIVLCSRFADTKRVLLRTSLIHIPGALLFLGYLPLCFADGVSGTAYWYLLGISALQSVALALHTVCEYKIPYYIFRVEDYGPISAVGGVLASVVSFGVGELMGALSEFAYADRMAVAFVLSFVFLAIAGVLQFFQKSLLPPREEQGRAESEKVPLSQAFRHKAFTHLLAGNFARGFMAGTISVLATAALSIGYDEHLTTAMVSVQSLTALLGCVVFGFLSRRLHPRYSVLFGSAVCVALPLLLIENRPTLFLVVYGAVVFGRTLVDYAIPAALMYVVPVEIAGTYHAWRMILLNAGTLLATFVAGYIPLPLLFGIAVVCQAVTGVNYFFVKMMKSNPQAGPLPESGEGH